MFSLSKGESKFPCCLTNIMARAKDWIKLKVPLTLQLVFFGRFQHLSRTHFQKNFSKILNPDFFTSA